MSTSTKILYSIIVALAIASCIFVLAREDDSPKALPLTSEQGDSYEQLTHVRKGDIVMDPTGTLCGRNTATLNDNMKTLVVTGLAIDGCYLKGINMPLPSIFSFEELARKNCSVIRYETQEWHDAMRAVYTYTGQ